MINPIVFLYAGMYSCARRAKDKDFSVVLGFSYLATHYSYGIMFFFFELYDTNINAAIVILCNLLCGIFIYWIVKKHYKVNKEKTMLYLQKYFLSEIKANIFVIFYVILTTLIIVPSIYFGLKLAILLK